MRMSLLLPVAAALAVFAVESSGQAIAASRSVARDHRTAPVVRDHREGPVVRDHRVGPVVRDHRTARPVVRDHRVAPAVKKVIRAGRNYDKTPDRKQVIVNGKRVPRKVDGGPVIRDHRTAGPVVRDHRAAGPVVRDHRAAGPVVRDHRTK
jgi:hypothetical protein